MHYARWALDWTELGIHRFSCYPHLRLHFDRVDCTNLYLRFAGPDVTVKALSTQLRQGCGFLERKCRQAPCLGISVRMFINNTDKLDKERTDLWWAQVSVMHYAATGSRENARKFVHEKVLF
jgi:hypothetical protein